MNYSEDNDDVADLEIVKRAIVGDMEALEELYKKYSDFVLGVCHHYGIRNNIQRVDLAPEELAMDVWIYVFENLQKFNQLPNDIKGSRRTFKSWLYRVSRNVSLKTLDNMKKEYMYSSALIPSDVEMATELKLEQNSQYLDILNNILDNMSEEYKKIIELSFVYEMTVSEIADKLKIPKNTVSSIKRRTIKMLKDRISKSGLLEKLQED